MSCPISFLFCSYYIVTLRCLLCITLKIQLSEFSGNPFLLFEDLAQKYCLIMDLWKFNLIKQKLGNGSLILGMEAITNALAIIC